MKNLLILAVVASSFVASTSFAGDSCGSKCGDKDKGKEPPKEQACACAVCACAKCDC